MRAASFQAPASTASIILLFFLLFLPGNHAAAEWWLQSRGTGTCADPVIQHCGSAVGDTSLATADLSNYNCGSQEGTGAEIVYAFDPVATGPLTVLLHSISGDNDLYILEGSCDPVSACVAASEEFGPDDELTFDATFGTTYYIVVEAFSPGEFELILDGTGVGGACPENCTNGIDDDADSDIDCDDADCSTFPACLSDDVFGDGFETRLLRRSPQ
jgi:hypothetical protein